jgi:hypothetical protein
MAGTFGGLSVTLAKSTVELIKAAFAGRDSFAHVETYIIVGAMAVRASTFSRRPRSGQPYCHELSVVTGLPYVCVWVCVCVVGMCASPDMPHFPDDDLEQRAGQV